MKYFLNGFSLKGADTLSGSQRYYRYFCFPSEKGSTLKGNILHLIGENFRIDPFSDGDEPE